MSLGLTGVSYYGDVKMTDYDLTGAGNCLSWRPGWKLSLDPGPHRLELVWPPDREMA
jgi:hypothetical protein